ncbi:PREDICTED: ring-infected erythrocyte surface antigen-like isoform X2 [Papilio polytes]|uniref:ring-infected erythrocyte surface antigen-like isoform X2 n=1 Tax=Papilio polytes TaxID=76194 RepID=UPI00067677FE|nr:PREDICTED: ring-infected erythrocyte surface antigen-like isoform X2 [Papilio polytes]
MGKPNKKLKAERINAIRKQYDSFIEEDKKRKDRNEYILERLDKIRNTSAIVQVRNAPKDYFTTVNQNQLVDDRKYMGKCLSRYEKPQYCFNTVSNSNVVTSINEEEILKAISKKYILIPRHMNILEQDDNYILKSNFDDNGDWRKKYSILEELKQNKKQEEQETNLNLTRININDGELNSNKIEEPNLQTTYLLSNNKNPPENNRDNIETITNYDEVISNTETDKLEEKPEIEKNFINDADFSQDFKEPISNCETENLSENTDSGKQPITPQTIPTNPTKDENVYVSIDNANEPHVGDSTNDLTQKEIIQAEYEIEIKPKEEDVQLEKVQYSNINIENQNLEETSQSKNYQHDEENVQNNIKSNDLNSQEKLLPSSVNEPLPVENINLIVPNIEQVEDNIKDQIVENQIEPENKEVPTIAYIKDFDDTGHDAQINEFEAEQSEMFNSDPNDIEYAYNQTGSAVIDDYENPEGYARDESYAYFEGTAEQQVYSGDINLHEETTEQYDPHYEAQYANYEDRNQIIEENYDNYEGEVSDTQPQTLEQVQFEVPDNNVIMEVERELDAEQNYNIAPPEPEDDNIHLTNEAKIPEGEGNTVDENPAQRPVS